MLCLTPPAAVLTVWTTSVPHLTIATRTACPLPTPCGVPAAPESVLIAQCLHLMPAREWTLPWLAQRLFERETCPATCRTARLRWQRIHRPRRRRLLASHNRRWERHHLPNQAPRSRPWAGRRPSKTRATQSGSSHSVYCRGGRVSLDHHKCNLCVTAPLCCAS